MTPREIPGRPKTDLDELMRLVSAGFRIESVTITFTGQDENGDPIPEAAVQVKKDFFERQIRSSEPAFTEHCFRLHKSLDTDGNRVLRPYKNLNRYWDEAKTFGHDADAKRKAVGERFNKRQLRLEGNLKSLFTECLKSRDWGCSKFLPLKESYFEMGLAVLLESQQLLNSQKRLYEACPEAKPYGASIEQILNGAWQKEETFIKRCVRFTEYAGIDVEDAVLRAHGQRKHVQDLFDMLAPKAPMPARKGLPHLLDAYRRYCESLRPFIRALAQALRVAEGRPPLPDNMRYQKIVDVIKSSQYGFVVDCLDPAIRNSEAHGATEYDDDAALVVLTEPDEAGGRRTIKSYSYWQITDMLRRLERGLFPAMLSEFAVHQIGLIATVMHSEEYFYLLLSIDNLAD